MTNDAPLHQSIFPHAGFWQMVEDHLVSKQGFLQKLQHALTQEYLAVVVTPQTTPFVGATVRRVLSPSGSAPSGILPVYASGYVPHAGDTVVVRVLPGGTKSYIVGTSAPQGAVRTITSNTTVTTADGTVLVNAASLTVTLPNATTCNRFEVTIKNTNNGSSTTIATVSSQKIDNASSFSLSSALVSINIVSDGANWWVI